MREDEQVGSREPFGGGFEVVDPRLSQQAPGGVVASLFEIHQRVVVFFRIEFLFVVLFEQVAIREESNFGLDGVVAGQFVPVDQSTSTPVRRIECQSPSVPSEVVEATVVEVSGVAPATDVAGQSEQSVLLLVGQPTADAGSSIGVVIRLQCPVDSFGRFNAQQREQAPGRLGLKPKDVVLLEVDSFQREVDFRGGSPEVGREEDGGVAEQEQVVLRGDPIDGVVLVGLSG